MNQSNIEIRRIKETDEKTIQRLSDELGYPLSLELTKENIRQINADNNQIAFVAELEGEIVGWIQFQKRVLLVSNPFAEIVGLIVDSKYRKKKVGRSLVQKGIYWAEQENIHKIRVRSNVIRNESHGFYKSIGFMETKQQKVYDLDLK